MPLVHHSFPRITTLAPGVFPPASSDTTTKKFKKMTDSGGTGFSVKHQTFLALATYLHQREIIQNAESTYKAFGNPQHPLYAHIGHKDEGALTRRCALIQNAVEEYLPLTQIPQSSERGSAATPSTSTHLGGPSGASGSTATDATSELEHSVRQFIYDIKKAIGDTANDMVDAEGAAGSSALDGHDIEAEIFNALKLLRAFAKAKAVGERQLATALLSEGKLVKEIQQMQEQDAQKQISNLQSINAGLRASINAAREESQILKGQQMSKDNEVREARLARAAWEAEKGTVLKRNARLEKDASSHQTQIDILNNWLTDKNDEVLQAEVVRKAAVTENRLLRRELGGKGREIRELQNQNEVLRSKLEWCEEQRQIHLDAYRMKEIDCKGQAEDVESILGSLEDAKAMALQCLARRRGAAGHGEQYDGGQDDGGQDEGL
ncbi:hypothetical protein HDV00_004708 [Rhizophlyctis rosea]|nr:hypothetical protein HDV00_004708 [Rhizophlyctis rosea]